MVTLPESTVEAFTCQSGMGKLEKKIEKKSTQNGFARTRERCRVYARERECRVYAAGLGLRATSMSVMLTLYPTDIGKGSIDKILNKCINPEEFKPV